MGKGMSGFCIKPRGGGGSGGGDDGGGTKCGRWNPTAEQVKVLTDLFKSGLRTPSTDQIQKISSQLSFYGKIESKNVFYWFQNHKARERQKRRRVSPAEQNVTLRQDPISSTKNLTEIDEVSEAGRAIETLQLFPLNSFRESESEKMSLFTNEGKEITSHPYTFVTNQVDYPPLDLRLSFM